MIRGVFRTHPMREHNHAELLESGDAFFTRAIELIRLAKHHLHLQTYIFDEDKTGKEIIAALLESAQRGVKVLVVVDAYASNELSRETKAAFEASGILFKRFSPLVYSRFKIGRRLHHKIISIDGQRALVGGINIADKYSGANGETPWLDFAVEIDGSAVHDIERVCERIWKRRVILNAGIRHKLAMPKHRSGAMKIRMLQNDWMQRRIEISSHYKHEIQHAQHEIILVVSYFLPGARIRKLIRRACERGVKVTLITGAFSDVVLFKPATMFLYTWLLKNGVRILEWEPSVLHGKLAIFDRRITTVGSYNINKLSDYGSLELNALIKDEKFADTTATYIQQLMDKYGKEVHLEGFLQKSGPLLTAWRWLCYQMIRLSLRILFLLMQQRSRRY